MFSVVLKVASNIIGSQHKEFVIQKMNVAFDIISDHHGHICVPAHCIPHRRYQNQAKVVVVEWGEIISIVGDSYYINPDKCVRCKMCVTAKYLDGGCMMDKYLRTK